MTVYRADPPSLVHRRATSQLALRGREFRRRSRAESAFERESQGTISRARAKPGLPGIPAITSISTPPRCAGGCLRSRSGRRSWTRPGSPEPELTCCRRLPRDHPHRRPAPGGAGHLIVDPIENEHCYGVRPAVAVSPDGWRLAFATPVHARGGNALETVPTPSLCETCLTNASLNLGHAFQGICRLAGTGSQSGIWSPPDDHVIPPPEVPPLIESRYSAGQ